MVDTTAAHTAIHAPDARMAAVCALGATVRLSPPDLISATP